MRLITDTTELAQACAKLAAGDFVAVDTEFMRETTYWPKLCLVQIAGEGGEALIDPLAETLSLDPLIELMNEPSVLKVFHAARQDLEIFYHLSGKVPAPLFDTQVAAAAVGLGDSIAYDALVRALTDHNVDKSSRFTDWARRPLSDKQLTYALSDVTHLRELFPRLHARLEKLGRADWLDEEMQTLSAPSTYALDPDEAWRRLKMRKTSPPYLAALKAAARWREQEAQSRDTPRQRVLKDDVLYEIALQRPRTADDLAGLRAVPRGFERSRAAKGLLDALGPAIEDPAAHAPKPPKSKPVPAGTGPVVDLLKVLLRVQAEAHNVAPRLIATVSDVEQIAADDEADVPALRGWRREVFGAAALKLKRGEGALRLKRGRIVVED
ncbi:MAG: ribonuclease D [Maricaulaceae bacterium]|jgi:ribonuclease D